MARIAIGFCPNAVPVVPGFTFAVTPVIVTPMFIAMNRFRIAPGFEDAFEDIWRNRKSYLDEVPGFREFHLLRGPKLEDHTLFASHSVWDNRKVFEAWTDSESFRKAHAQAKSPEGMHLGHPNFEGFEVVL